MLRKIFTKTAVLIAVLVLPCPALTDSLDMDQIWNLARIGEKCSGVDRRIIASIILAESSGHPYAVNHNGRELYFRSKSEAIRYVYREDDPSIGVGLMQIHYSYWYITGYTVRELFNPEINVCTGSRILRYYLDTTDWKNSPYGIWEAVGRYHSSNPKRKRKYIYRVYSIYLTLKETEKESRLYRKRTPSPSR